MFLLNYSSLFLNLPSVYEAGGTCAPWPFIVHFTEPCATTPWFLATELHIPACVTRHILEVCVLSKDKCLLLRFSLSCPCKILVYYLYSIWQRENGCLANEAFVCLPALPRWHWLPVLVLPMTSFLRLMQPKNVLLTVTGKCGLLWSERVFDGTVPPVIRLKMIYHSQCNLMQAESVNTHTHILYITFREK